MTSGQPHSLPHALSDAIQAVAAQAVRQGRLVSLKIVNALPTWVEDDLMRFSGDLQTCLLKHLAKAKSRELYVICTMSKVAAGEIELEFTATDLPGFKLSSDAKPFFTFKLRPFSERETFRHLLPVDGEADHLRVAGQLLSGFCILCVDDSEESLDYETRLIEKFGGRCVCARTGEEAIEKALKHHFDVVLMDIKMPTLDGNAAMRVLADQRYRIPVVALSAFSSVKERKESLKNGFADYLSKPIIAEQLVKTITRLTHRSLPIVQSEPSPDPLAF